MQAFIRKKNTSNNFIFEYLVSQGRMERSAVIIDFILIENKF